MHLFSPTYQIHRITTITTDFLRERGIRALFLDVDNTLTTHDNPTPMPGILEWLQTVREEGILLFALSNNHYDRIKPFCDKLGLPFVCDAKKPLPIGIRRGCRTHGLLKEEVALVGDQIFTDILCANLFGCVSILVEPIELEKGGFLLFKRKLEHRLHIMPRKRRNEL